ncbi:MAG TPA: aminotransferase class I/II-fold pyridoxal phosphate-dependent enzyme [Acidobacteriota bacterium]|nr:aminotransferase class I/II-fold pyridoxal phosphate-dependent enzyme [Acidobacteriota bacterium]
MMSDTVAQSAGVQRYVEKAERMLKAHSRYVAEMRKLKFDTIAVHGLYSVQESIEKNQGSVIEPIYMSTSEAYRDSDELEAALAYLIPSWVYTRIHNPTIHYLETTLALMEGYGCDCETSALATSSGMSAVFIATEPLLVRKTGSEKMNFVATAQCYGGTYQQFSARRMQEQGIEVRWVVHAHDTEEWASLIDENTRFVYGEMPSNPGQSIFDIAGVAEVAHRAGVPLIVDSTVATPALMRPLQHGADIVVHSSSKSMTMSGFGIGGAVISRNNIVSNVDNPEMKENFAIYAKLLPFRDYGPCISPFNAGITLSELKTLRCKMEMVSRSTQKVAEFLESHPKVEQVHYLGLPSDPLHGLASKYMKLVDSEGPDGKPMNLFGHLMSFRVRGSAQDTRDVFDRFHRIFRATDLGRIKSVATIPAISTHLQQGEEARRMADVPPTLIRLCVGGEHPDDIINDLDQALAVVQ